MNSDSSIAWTETLPEGSLMPTSHDDDFANFLEFGLGFSDLDGHGATPRPPPRSIQTAEPTLATTLAENDLTRMETESTSQPPSYTALLGDLSLDLHGNGTARLRQPYSSAEVGYFSSEQSHQHKLSHQPQQRSHHSQHLQQKSQLQRQPHPYHHNQSMIPPTPNSIELHGRAARFPLRVDVGHDIYDQYTNAFYTPLVSPAMTPLETQFRLPEYTIPGEYFTPLTSPALEAQNVSSNGYQFQSTQAPSTGFMQSSVDPNGSHIASAPSSPGVARRPRRRPSAPTRTAGRAAKASPSIRPQGRRKQAISAHLLADDVAQALAGDLSSGGHLLTNGSGGVRYDSHESSGQDSVSPEPISEPLMPPPALPQTRKSPVMSPQVTEPSTDEPATPATLMRIPSRQQSSTRPFSAYGSPVPHETPEESMEDVMLPEAVTDLRPRMPRLDTAIDGKESLQGQGSSKTPLTSEPKSATASEKLSSGSMTPSPHPGSMTSPSGPVGRKPETKLSGGINRKRQSASSSHVSPALRPRISPSIQPLVRGDSGMSSESSALYLASKSNYQHILDGTLLPGVSYPETLAENLSSKRTNHKLAEQGRRNRINTALKEIESLLPPGFSQERSNQRNDCKVESTSSTKNGEKEKEKSPHQTISKASTVEMAIDYIKALKKELEDTRARLKTAELKLADSAAEAPSTASETTLVMRYDTEELKDPNTTH
ncbi:hypothetical protein V8E54_004120 [Elaphomyces granulatus]